MSKIIMTIIMAVVFLFLLPFIVNANKIVELTPQQIQCIQYAYDEGNKIELYGDTWGETTASIAYQESHCNSPVWQKNGVIVGDINSKGKPKSLGPMQVQMATARYTATKFPYLFTEQYGHRIPSDEELTIDLLIDIKFNIRIGVHYYAYLLKYKGGDWDKAILAYNRGPGKNVVDVNNYVHKVKMWRTTKILPYLNKNYITKRISNGRKD